MKILVFDIDGTISDEVTGNIPESCRNAIKQAQANGHLCFVNTGRPICTIEKRIHELGMDGFICGCGCYIEYKGKVLLESKLPIETCRKIVESSEKNNVYSVLEGVDGVYWDPNNTHPIVKATFEKYTECGFDMSKTWYDENLSFDKFACWVDEKSNFEAFCHDLNDEFTIITRAVNFYEIIQKQYSKATGIQFLLDYFHLDKDDAYAFGDSPNDLSMLEYVDHSIAMGNASKEVKDKVAFITKDLDDDGIEYAMKHFGIID